MPGFSLRQAVDPMWKMTTGRRCKNRTVSEFLSFWLQVPKKSHTSRQVFPQAKEKITQTINATIKKILPCDQLEAEASAR
jgi:hypothetical protein